MDRKRNGIWIGIVILITGCRGLAVFAISQRDFAQEHKNLTNVDFNVCASGYRLIPLVGPDRCDPI